MNTPQRDHRVMGENSGRVGQDTGGGLSEID